MKRPAHTTEAIAAAKRARTAASRAQRRPCDLLDLVRRLRNGEPASDGAATDAAQFADAWRRLQLVSNRSRIMPWPKGRPRSAESRAKMSAAALRPETREKKVAARLGKTMSPETRAKISAAQRGKVVSAETKAKLSAKNRGKKHTPEARAKISQANRMRLPVPPERHDDYRLFRRKRFSRAEATALIMGEG